MLFIQVHSRVFVVTNNIANDYASLPADSFVLKVSRHAKLTWAMKIHFKWPRTLTKQAAGPDSSSREVVVIILLLVMATIEECIFSDRKNVQKTCHNLAIYVVVGHFKTSHISLTSFLTFSTSPPRPFQCRLSLIIKHECATLLNFFTSTGLCLGWIQVILVMFILVFTFGLYL